MFRYLQSFELVINISLSQKEGCQLSIAFLEKLANLLDIQFHCQDFNKLLSSKISERKNSDSGNEYLFNSWEDLNFQLVNLSILNNKDRLFIFIIINGWIHDFALSTEIKKCVSRIFLLKAEDVFEIEMFFENPIKLNLSHTNNFFVIGPDEIVNSDLEGIWADAHRPKQDQEQYYISLPSINETFNLLYVPFLKAFILKTIDKNKLPYTEYSFNSWIIISSGDQFILNSKPVFDYFDLKKEYFRNLINEPNTLQINSLSFNYSNGKGIKKINLDIYTASLVGILGKEGNGKSTFLRILAGEINSYQGEININGYDLKKDLYHIKSLIGYVSEDDLLFEELTVFENLYYSAKFFLDKISDQQIISKIENLLREIDMIQYRDQVVGSFQNKKILPGQRRLLNIALELIREPQILIVDDALMPLSMNDSVKIIEVLSDYSYKGNIVITSITQCSSDIAALFDKFLILDDGGLPVYYGKLKEAFPYFSNLLGMQCDKNCSPDPENLLNLMNLKRVGTKISSERYLSPITLYEKFCENNKPCNINNKKFFPGNKLNTPTLDRQYVIFSLRNFKNKISRSRDLAYALLVMPIIGVFLSIFLRENSGTEYSFANNDNIPVYFFISILVVFFIGLTQSANEILRERNLNKKQEYLNLSRFSYINSKITYLFIIAFFQSILFAIVADLILGLKQFIFWHWIILFSVQAFAIIAGLIFSDTQSKLENIYLKSIPVVLLMQIIFGGCFFDLNKLHPNPKMPTPIVSDFVPSRWAYEALLVKQFKENDYEKNFFDLDRNSSQGMFYAHHLIPALSAQIAFVKQNYQTHPDTCRILLKSVRRNITNLPLFNEVFPYENVDLLNIKDFNDDLASDVSDYIEYINISMFTLFENAMNKKDSLQNDIQKRNLNDYLDQLKRENFNYAIAAIVTDNDKPDQLKYIDGRPVQISNPIFQYPSNDLGRELMFVPEKKFNHEIISTFEFNISMIWLLNVLLYIILLTNLVNLIKKVFYRI